MCRSTSLGFVKALNQNTTSSIFLGIVFLLSLISRWLDWKRKISGNYPLKRGKCLRGVYLLIFPEATFQKDFLGCKIKMFTIVKDIWSVVSEKC